MVRFKYRNLLVEFLDPAAVSPFPPAAPTIDLDGDEEDAMNGDDGGGPPDPEDDELLPTPSVPFVLPLPEATSKPLLGDDASSAIFRAIKGSVQAVFGDEGWGRVASSLRGELGPWRGGASALTLTLRSDLLVALYHAHDRARRAPALPPAVVRYHYAHCYWEHAGPPPRRGC